MGQELGLEQRFGPCWRQNQGRSYWKPKIDTQRSSLSYIHDLFLRDTNDTNFLAFLRPSAVLLLPDRAGGGECCERFG